MQCKYKTELTPVVNNFMTELTKIGYNPTLSNDEGEYYLRVEISNAAGPYCNVNVYYSRRKKRFTTVVNGKLTDALKNAIKACLNK